MRLLAERSALCTVGKPTRLYSTFTWPIRVICALGYTTSAFVLATVVRLVVRPIPDANVHYAVDDSQGGETGAGVGCGQRV